MVGFRFQFFLHLGQALKDQVGTHADSAAAAIGGGSIEQRKTIRSMHSRLEAAHKRKTKSRALAQATKQGGSCREYCVDPTGFFFKRPQSFPWA